MSHQDEKTFVDFDKAFQEKIVQAMFMDKIWAAQFTEVLNINFFHYAYLRLVTNEYVQHYQKYKEFPSIELLLSVLKTKLKEEGGGNASLKEQLKEFLIKVESKKDLGDLNYVKDKALDFCKRAALQKALEQSVDYIQTEDYDKVIDVVKNAIAAGNEHDPGLELSEDIDVRYSDTFRKTISTGIPELDQKKVLNGGLGSGELGIVVAPSAYGKSHILVQLGCSALRTRKNVVHYTFELNERAVGIRYDSNLLDIPSLECYERQEEIKHYYEKNKKRLGKLRIKYYSTGEASCNTIRTHIEKLNMIGFYPDIILVDYAGIMKSTSRHESLRQELKGICEQLRALSGELDCPIWTAIQSNKEGTDAEVVDETNMAESYAQAHIADFIIGLSRKRDTSGFGFIFVAKNRNGLDKIKYPIHLDTAKSRLTILTDEEASRLHAAAGEEGLAPIRQKFQQIYGK